MAILPVEEEDYWTELLQLIRGGLVIPIVGSELLQVDDPPEPFYQRLARDLAAELRLSCGGPASLHEVTCRYLEERRTTSLSAVYATVRKLLETRNYPLPAPLRKLAAITPFQLFLTTTFDSSLEKAIDETRYHGTPTARAIAYSLDYGGDLPDELKNEGAYPHSPIVFHFFGLPAPFNKFAVTDEDVLEYVHSLQSGAHRPETLFQYVADKHLLIIGSSFSDWLERFFIRSTKRERLWNARGREDFLVGATSMRDPSFATFVQHFGGGMRVFSLTPVDFVDELHRRWMAEQPAATAVQESAAESAAATELAKMKTGSIFLSYASEDRAAADTVSRQLDEAKLDVWIDHRKLRLGETFERVIRKNIREASIFIGLISRQALMGGYSFFRTEWEDAIDIARGMPPSPPFILLLSIDGTRVDQHEELFPPLFARLHYELAPDGTLSAEQIERIVSWFVQHEASREVPR